MVRKMNKIMSITLILLILIQLSSFATSSIVIDPARVGSITITVLQNQDGAAEEKEPTGEEQKYSAEVKGLGGVKFKLYKVDSDYEDTKVPKNAVQIENEKETSNSGVISFKNLALGRYLVEFTGYPSNANEIIKNFLIDVPMINATSDAWNYDVKVYPKIETIYGSYVITIRDENGKPIKGLKFKLKKKNEKTGEYEDYTNNEYIKQEYYITDKNGQICIDFLPKGDYMLVQVDSNDEHGLDTTPIKFTISKSSTRTKNEDGLWVSSDESLNTSKTNYTIPEATSYRFEKSVNSGLTVGCNIDDIQLWKISTDIPKNIADYTRFIITDEINEKLNFDLNNVIVKADDIELKPEVDYNINYEDNLLKIELINVNDISGKRDLNIMYETTFIREQLILGEDISNTAKLYWDTKYDNDGADENEKELSLSELNEQDSLKVLDLAEPASVHTGGVRIKKVDQNNKILPGAKFKIARTEEEARANVFVQIDGVDLESISNEEGLVIFEGLAYGEINESNETAFSKYYLVELEAPKGYNVLKDPVEIIVDKDSYQTEDLTVIQNRQGILLPETGGIGTVVFVVAGISIISVAIVMFKRKK